MIDVPDSFDRRQWRLVSAVGICAFLVWTHFTKGLRGDHLTIAFFFLALFWGPWRKAAYFGYLALPFLMVGLLYENLPLAMPFRGSIHVADLYRAELALFSVSTPEGPIIWPEYFRRNPVTALDFVSGLTYMVYLAEVFIIAGFLFFKDQKAMSQLAWGWLFLNILGMITWITFPAAPPWYVEQHGLGPVVLDAAPSAAGAARFDDLVGVDVFRSFYSRNLNVFGALPSLHCGYPTLVAGVVWRYGWRWRVPTVLYVVVMSFSAVYLRHHYVLDVLAGVVYGVIAYTGVMAAVRWRSRAKQAKQSADIGGLQVSPEPSPPSGEFRAG